MVTNGASASKWRYWFQNKPKAIEVYCNFSRSYRNYGRCKLLGILKTWWQYWKGHYAIACSLSVYVFDVLIEHPSNEKFWSTNLSRLCMVTRVYHRWCHHVNCILGFRCVGYSARVIQALARDNLQAYSKSSPMTPRGDEPRVVLVLSYVLAQLGFFAGDLNTISAIISNFSYWYTFLQFAVLFESCRRTKFSTRVILFWHTAICGVRLLCSFHPQPTQLFNFRHTLLAVLVHYTAPVVPWGDVTQAVIYHQVRKYLLRLDVRKEHPKFCAHRVELDQPHKSLNLIDVPLRKAVCL